MKNTINILLLLLLAFQSLTAQKILLKNQQSKIVDLNDILKQSEKDQPVLIYTYAATFCDPCLKALTELQKHYAELKKKYNLRVIAINLDRDKEYSFDILKKSVESVINLKYGHWDFEIYYDYDQQFFKAIKATGAPSVFFYVNNKLQFRHYGFNQGSIREPEKSMQYIVNIIKQSGDDINYFNKNWRRTTKDVEAAYKRYISKVGDHYSIVDNWITGEKQMEGQYLDHWGTIKDGLFKYYNKTGQLKNITKYVNGKPNGDYVSYYQNGAVQWKGSYKNGKYNGVWKGFHKNGKNMTERIWNTGKLVEIRFFNDKNGKRLLTNGTGIYYEYYPNGKIHEEITYQNNKVHGSYKSYYLDGKIKAKGSFWEDKRDSVWYYYDKDGKETDSEMYERGLKVTLKKK